MLQYHHGLTATVKLESCSRSDDAEQHRRQETLDLTLLGQTKPVGRVPKQPHRTARGIAYKKRTVGNGLEQLYIPEVGKRAESENTAQLSPRPAVTSLSQGPARKGRFANQ